jgi:riboflavin kinase/FMN adenylyltransferase
MPLRGVFCVQVIVPAMGKTYFGVANVGMRPTVGTDPSLRVEVHVFDFEGSLYHERLTVYFLHRLRDEAKFESFDALIKQIQADVVLAKAYFNRVLVNDRL